MGKARILGNNAKIYVQDSDTLIGEVDKFSAKKVDELKKYQPLGQKDVTSNVVHKGWELSFEGGKVDFALAQLLHAQDQEILAGSAAPYFKVRQEIEYMDGKVEVWEYPACSFYGYELDAPTEELTEKFSGFCGGNRKKLSGDVDEATPLSAIGTILKAMGYKPRKS